MKKIAASLMAVSLLAGISACSGSGTEIELLDKISVSPKANTIISEAVTMSETFENPVISLSNEDVWPEYGVGDPFVMRWNGKYYLYNSTKDWYVGIQCWTSDDLVNWNYEGFCAEEELTMSAYAPEVTYYNGKFYMYTSPAGAGHYVLESDSPTGPFVAVTENFGLSIDGNVFIDDNGDWYFSSASGDGIQVYKMNSPTEIDAESQVSQGLIMQAGETGTSWTEGSMLIKYGDKYYMTYCGNHVWSYGYRINYASGDGPLSLVPGTDNPILLNTDPNTVSGIGHSSTVLGPNLDSLYLVYHSSYVAPQREMNIAPIVLNGNYLQALGPTVTSQQSPEMPDIYSRFDCEESLVGWTVENAAVFDGILTVSEGGSVISEIGFTENYTAEFNFLSVSGKAGAVFGYLNDKNFGKAMINTETNELEIVFAVDGSESVYKVPVKASFGEDYDWSQLQQLTLRKYGSEYTFLLNNRTVCEYESELGSGAIGVMSESGEMKVGFVGAEGNVWLSSMKEYNKPLESKLLAITCVEEDIVLSDHAGVNYVTVSAGESYNYYVNISESSRNSLGIKYSSSEDVSYEMYLNGSLLTSGVLPASENEEITSIVRGIELTQGVGVLTVKFLSGSADIFSYEFVPSETVESQTFDLSQPIYSEGEWTVTDGVFNTNCRGKYFYGSDKWEDYTVSATFIPKTKILMGKLAFRASQAAWGDANNDINLGEGFYIGYYVDVLRTNKQATVSLNKQIYGPTELVSVPVEIDALETVDIKVEVKDSNIKVYLRGELIIDYTDPDPILAGYVGFQNVGAANITNLTVSE